MSDRVFTQDVTVRLGDVGRDGRLRLAPLARHHQDIAYDDISDAGFGRSGAWVLRRIDLDVRALPRFLENVRMETRGTGLGPRWAERVTTLRGDRGAHVVSRAVCIFVDPRTGRPARLPDGFDAWFPHPDGAPRVSTHLIHPPAPADATARVWTTRASDFDLMGHMNNAAYWEPVDELLAAGERGAVRCAQLEYHTPINPHDEVAVVVAPARGDEPLTVWIRVDGETRASARVWFTS